MHLIMKAVTDTETCVSMHLFMESVFGSHPQLMHGSIYGVCFRISPPIDARIVVYAYGLKVKGSQVKGNSEISHEE